MANYTGANVINAGDASNYQADIYTFGIGADTSEVAFFYYTNNKWYFKTVKNRVVACI